MNKTRDYQIKDCFNNFLRIGFSAEIALIYISNAWEIKKNEARAIIVDELVEELKEMTS